MSTLFSYDFKDPALLEKRYRQDKAGFKKEFLQYYPQLKGQPLADFWYERLKEEPRNSSWGSPREVIQVLLLGLFAGLIAKLPAFMGITEDFFYPRNMSFILFPVLMAYFLIIQKAPGRTWGILLGVLLIALVYINFLPDHQTSDTLLLACIHLPVFCWFLLGGANSGNAWPPLLRRGDYLRYNGDLVVIVALIGLAIGLLAAVTIGLFKLLGFNIEEFYGQYIIVMELAAAPVLGTFILEKNPQLVSRVSPIIARIFSPLVLITLLVYLVALIFARKDPYNDREFLLAFNAMLAGVTALIFFSVVETSKTGRGRIEHVLLLTLSLLAVLVNAIALSAILFRIGEWGFTPNRIAVLGANLLFMTQLILLTIRSIQVLRGSREPQSIEMAIAGFLPAYFYWAGTVTFLFPLLFGFR